MRNIADPQETMVRVVIKSQYCSFPDKSDTQRAIVQAKIVDKRSDLLPNRSPNIHINERVKVVALAEIVFIRAVRESLIA
ncbi:hypothetical protein PFISCL1PPCAC_26207 [Pristionchus fissidentatus]|uniref:Uncharacterized protein n=1 Tax=Pristionchus fissidentatus TaxID=1538716 RepID=A0AAV5WTH9_9BILA|nr:hypothetical protein PFISCL1PPCAC_26207 [Pristionchus fissidentatus]